jgi:uncharacterized membrane protein SirB2
LDYALLKGIHVSSVAASYTLFFVRGVWMMQRPQMLVRKSVRILPHVIDTILLASAIAMAVMLRQYPFVAPWLTAKVTGLVLYILLGTVALKRGRTQRIRVGAWIAAQVVFAYIVSVALTRNPVPWAS